MAKKPKTGKADKPESRNKKIARIANEVRAGIRRASSNIVGLGPHQSENDSFRFIQVMHAHIAFALVPCHGLSLPYALEFEQHVMFPIRAEFPDDERARSAVLKLMFREMAVAIADVLDK